MNYLTFDNILIFFLLAMLLLTAFRLMSSHKEVASGRENTRDIKGNEAAITAWIKAGLKAPLIQHVFPDMPFDDREFPLNGSTPEEWEGIFEGVSRECD